METYDQPPEPSAVPIPQHGREGIVSLPDEPTGIEFDAYVDGFEAVIPSGRYLTGAIYAVLATSLGLTGMFADTIIWNILGVATFFYSGYHAFRHLFGTLRIKLKNGKLRIREGILEFGLNYETHLDDVRAVLMTQNAPARNSKKSKKVEELVLRTRKNEVTFGRRISREKRKFLHDVLQAHLRKVTRWY